MSQRLLIVLLRFGALMTGLAFLTVPLPVESMVSTHRWLGLGDLPQAPIVEYLARSVAAFYGFHGVLLFLLWDVLSAGWAPTDAALVATHTESASFAPVVGYGLLFLAGIAVSLLSLVGYERWMRGVVSRTPPAREGAQVPSTRVTVDAAGRPSPGLRPDASSELPAPPDGIAGWSAPRRLALLIAVGIGVHNFAEGLAIGQSAASGEIALATVLVIGFALHNATEGFGIVAPLTGDQDAAGQRRVPSWGFLLMLAGIAGGPTFVGTIVGHAVVNPALSVLFLSLAAGSILYVIVQLITVASRAKRADLLAYGLLAGLTAGFITDGILIAAGA